MTTNTHTDSLKTECLWCLATSKGIKNDKKLALRYAPWSTHSSGRNANKLAHKLSQTGRTIQHRIALLIFCHIRKKSFKKSAAAKYRLPH